MRANLSPEGVDGDRQYGLIDAASGLPAVPEKDLRWRKALHLQAASGGELSPSISFPDGQTYSIEDRVLNAALTDYFGFATAVAAYEHTVRRFDFPLTKFRHRHFAMHMLTTASLQYLAKLRQVDAIDSRRLRPTVLIEVEGCGFVENAWIGRSLCLGTNRLTAQEATKRCGVTFISQPGLVEDPEILRSILRHNNRNLESIALWIALVQSRLETRCSSKPHLVARYQTSGASGPRLFRYAQGLPSIRRRRLHWRW